MKESGIPFTAPMDRAVLRAVDPKTQTHRLRGMEKVNAEADAIAEGWPAHPIDWTPHPEPTCWYAGLWEQINGSGSREANLWVWVVEFRQVGGITSTTSNTADVAGKVKACVRSPNASQESIANGAPGAAKAANDAKTATQPAADSSDGQLGARATQCTTGIME